MHSALDSLPSSPQRRLNGLPPSAALPASGMNGLGLKPYEFAPSRFSADYDRSLVQEYVMNPAALCRCVLQGCLLEIRCFGLLCEFKAVDCPSASRRDHRPMGHFETVGQSSPNVMFWAA